MSSLTEKALNNAYHNMILLASLNSMEGDTDANAFCIAEATRIREYVEARGGKIREDMFELEEG